MKRLLTLMALAVSISVAAHDFEPNDTTVIKHAKKVIIVNDNTSQQVKVVRGYDDEGKNVYESTVCLSGNDLVKTSREYKEDDDTCKVHDLSMHFGVGIATPTNVPDEMSFAPFKSWELFWTVIQYDYTPKCAWQTYSAGFQLGWHHYGLSTEKMFMKDDAGVIGLADYPANAGHRYSSINVFNISIPLLFTQKFDRKGDIKFSVGPVVNFNVYGSLTSGYEMGDVETELTTKKIGQRPVTVDFMGILKLYGVGLYCKYCPMSVLKNDCGPQFHSLSFGLYF